MPCYHPIPAWRSKARVQLHKELPDSAPLQLPCGGCLGCRTTRAQHWALRCRLEALEHKQTCVTTLTYSDEHLPPYLSKHHFQLWMKRLRKAHQAKLRFFGCGEYGEENGRPHYHAILFGVRQDASEIHDTWGMGRTLTDNVSMRSINYITGYTTKKLAWESQQERVDYETGEILWEPPFQLMSRGGRQGQGLGAKAKKYYQSWATYAINDGAKLSVPRYYKGAWDEQATPNEKEDNDYQKYQYALSKHHPSESQLLIKEKIHHARHKLKSALRRYG